VERKQLPRGKTSEKLCQGNKKTNLDRSPEQRKGDPPRTKNKSRKTSKRKTNLSERGISRARPKNWGGRTGKRGRGATRKTRKMEKKRTMNVKFFCGVSTNTGPDKSVGQTLGSQKVERDRPNGWTGKMQREDQKKKKKEGGVTEKKIRL